MGWRRERRRGRRRKGQKEREGGKTGRKKREAKMRMRRKGQEGRTGRKRRMARKGQEGKKRRKAQGKGNAKERNVSRKMMMLQKTRVISDLVGVAHRQVQMGSPRRCGRKENVKAIELTSRSGWVAHISVRATM
jgi:hypothetical protein